jgi:hypothetical protein
MKERSSRGEMREEERGKKKRNIERKGKEVGEREDEGGKGGIWKYWREKEG